jgi:hypothetical protein
MAACKECKKDVGCPCNLNEDGMCTTCMGKSNRTLVDNNRMITYPPTEPPANPEFITILQQKGLTKEEKLK